MKRSFLSLSLAAASCLLLAQCANQPSQPTRPGYTAYLPGQGVFVPQQPGAAPAPQYQQVAYTPGATPGPPGIAVEPVPGPYGYPAQTPPPAYSFGKFSSPSSMSNGAPWINAESLIMVDPASGRVLAAKNADTIRGVASTQKLLTALIVAESGNLDKPVRVTASDVAVEPTKLGLRPGETYTRRELVTVLLVKSCNDVANVLARDNAGSTFAFAQRMTSRARSLGASSSSFRNPHGLTAPGQFSTARDMARVAAVAYRNPVIRDAVCRRSYTFRFNSGRSVTLKNTNELLGRMPACDGMKTGYTNAAGRCLISSARFWGKEVILVQLGTKTKYIWDDGAAMMQWGLRR